MDNFFNVTMKSEETLTEDLSAFLLGLREPIRSGLNFVAAGFSYSLGEYNSVCYADLWSAARLC